MKQKQSIKKTELRCFCISSSSSSRGIYRETECINYPLKMRRTRERRRKGFIYLMSTEQEKDRDIQGSSVYT